MKEETLEKLLKWAAFIVWMAVASVVIFLIGWENNELEGAIATSGAWLLAVVLTGIFILWDRRQFRRRHPQ